jgi:Bacterial Ig-like domain
VWPPDGSVHGADVAVGAGFDEAMDVVSLRDGGLRITDTSGSPVAGTVVWRGLRASFVPAQAWAAGRYTARVSRVATDRVGNPLAAERVWSFTVDPGLGPPAGAVFTTGLRPAPAPPTSAR